MLRMFQFELSSFKIDYYYELLLNNKLNLFQSRATYTFQTKS